jgi:hypothetical protein
MTRNGPRKTQRYSAMLLTARRVDANAQAVAKYIRRGTMYD